MRRDVFQAIADPTRREIIRVIAAGALTLNTVAETFDMSRQAVSKHVKILTECGLITIRKQQPAIRGMRRWRATCVMPRTANP